MLHRIGGDCHVIAVCQPSVPVLAAVARMEAANDPYIPHSMTLMGGPIDTRINPTAVNKLAEERGDRLVPPQRHHQGAVPASRRVARRLSRLPAAQRFCQHESWIAISRRTRNCSSISSKGDGDSAQKHREFYDEYLAVMDLTAEFYLQTVDTVFVRHALPKGEMTHRGEPVDPRAIRNVALLTIEGEKDDISGVGQTEAAHALCVNIPASRKAHYLAARRRALRRVQRLALPLRDRAAHRGFHLPTISRASGRRAASAA